MIISACIVIYEVCVIVRFDYGQSYVHVIGISPEYNHFILQDYR
jgi:hypothetical protein